MTFWYKRVKKDISLIQDFVDYYEEQYLEAKKDVKLSGVLEKISQNIPHIVEHRYSQLQDIEAVLEFLNIQYRMIRNTKFKEYFENIKSARALTAKETDKYVDGDPDVVSIAELINDVAYVRNQYLSIMKGIDNKSFQINNIVKLRAAGINDAELF